MEKLKIYVKPSIEILACTPQSLMKTGSELPFDPGTQNNAPRRRTEVF